MRRITGANTIELSPGKLGFRDRNTGSGVPGTKLIADWANDVQEELLALIEAIGLVPSADRNQLQTAVQALHAPYAADTGTANALAVNVNRPGWSLAAGRTVRVQVLNNVIDDATIALSNGATALGAFDLLRHDGSALCPYDLVAGQIAELIYDGMAFRIPRVEGKTGDVLFTIADTSRTAHVPLNGLTIGPSGSGATGRANADCRKLYAHIYQKFADAICPVTSGRGLNAVADWAAGKPITLPDTRLRVPIGVDGMAGAGLLNLLAGLTFDVGDAATLGARGGEARHVLLDDELPPHEHDVDVAGTTGDDDPDHTHPFQRPENNINLNSGGSFYFRVNTNVTTNTSGANTRHQHDASLAGATGDGPGASEPHNNMPPFVTVVMFARL